MSPAANVALLANEGKDFIACSFEWSFVAKGGYFAATATYIVGDRLKVENFAVRLPRPNVGDSARILRKIVSIAIR
jgi:cystathionine beta-lyase family protein involved in aluminum resistance